MGLKCAHDVSQQVMEEVLQNFNNISVYLDNIDAFSLTWEHHILLLNKILHWLEANGFTINLFKFECTIQWQLAHTHWSEALV